MPSLVDLHRHLIVGPADTAAAHFHERLDVVDRRLENLQRRHVADLLGDLLQGIVNDLLRDGLLAVPHDAVDELA